MNLGTAYQPNPQHRPPERTSREIASDVLRARLSEEGLTLRSHLCDAIAGNLSCLRPISDESVRLQLWAYGVDTLNLEIPAGLADELDGVFDS